MTQKTKFIIGSLSILLIWIGLFALRLFGGAVDYERVNKGLDPLFAYDKVMYKDGGTIAYFGFGYSIRKLNRFYTVDERPMGYQKGTSLIYSMNWLFFNLDGKQQTYIVYEDIDK